jgi:hypothetical protein
MPLRQPIDNELGQCYLDADVNRKLTATRPIWESGVIEMAKKTKKAKKGKKK